MGIVACYEMFSGYMRETFGIRKQAGHDRVRALEIRAAALVE